MNYLNLTQENVKLYAAGKYLNPGCASILEFEEDYLRIKYLKVLIYKMLQNKKVNMRIILNHIICLSNVFPGDCLSKILFTEFETYSWNLLATFLFFLNLLPEHIGVINGSDIYFSKMCLEENLLSVLKNI